MAVSPVSCVVDSCLFLSTPEVNFFRIFIRNLHAAKAYSVILEKHFETLRDVLESQPDVRFTVDDAVESLLHRISKMEIAAAEVPPEGEPNHERELNQVRRDWNQKTEKFLTKFKELTWQDFQRGFMRHFQRFNLKEIRGSQESKTSDLSEENMNTTLKEFIERNQNLFEDPGRVGEFINYLEQDRVTNMKKFRMLVNSRTRFKEYGPFFKKLAVFRLRVNVNFWMWKNRGEPEEGNTEWISEMEEIDSSEFLDAKEYEEVDDLGLASDVFSVYEGLCTIL